MSELTKLGEELADVLAWSTENPNRTLFEKYVLIGVPVRYQLASYDHKDMPIKVSAEGLAQSYQIPGWYNQIRTASIEYTGEVDRLLEEVTVFRENAGEGYSNDKAYLASLIPESVI